MHGAPPPNVPYGNGPSAAQLKPQCRASKDAERQLASLRTAPPASLIFQAMDRDGGGEVSVQELQYGLSHGGRMEFSERTCQVLMNLYDADRNGVLSKQEFLALWGYLDQWRACFDNHDADKSGRVTRSELKSAMNQIGYRLSDGMYDKLLRVYDPKHTGGLGFDSFIQLFCELHSLTESFKKHDTERNGQATFQYEDFLDAAYTLHT
mmetsp:Transcript_13494/g.24978  ORF Transcript_13494/g.24978 Transcript_13494/m.24978 type:complete len:208 (-) Transcript_13494:85-708(-)